VSADAATGPLVMDTAGWFAALVARDPDHAQSHARLVHALRSGRQIRTSLLVIAEVHTLLVAQASAEVARAFLDVLDDPQVDVVYPDRDMMRELVRGNAAGRVATLTELMQARLERERTG
jgi:predicted nucleic acid-binding protein